jgi:hypothetical protein
VARVATPESVTQSRVEKTRMHVRVIGMTQGLAPWVRPTVESLTRVIAGETAGQRPTTLYIAEFAINVLSMFMTDDSPLPEVSLRDHGGLLFHWPGVTESLFVSHPADAYLEREGSGRVRLDESIHAEIDRLRSEIRATLTPERQSTNWLSAAQADLEGFGQLKQGWDQEHARPISSKAIDAAANLAAVVAGFTSLPPKVVPLPGGTVQFEWRQGRRLLTIEVGPSSKIHCLKWDPATKCAEERNIRIGDHAGVASLITWFAGAEKHAEPSNRRPPTS